MRLFFILLCLFSPRIFAADLPLQQLHLPPGFQIEVYATVPNARSMALGNNGIVYVGTKEEGKVFAVVPEGNHTKVVTIASGLNMPNGVAFKEGALYVAEVNRIWRYDNIEKNLAKPPKPIPISYLPSSTHHGWRYIAFGPDKKLYVAIGMPCNVCKVDNPLFGTIVRMEADGKNPEIYAAGIRNTVGFDWDAKGGLWFTENGRDWLGDDIPPDEIGYAPKPGMHFGFPYLNGDHLMDTRYSKNKPNVTFTPPQYDLPAHVAPLGLRFYTATLFPSEYQNQMFIAEHGSWNSTRKKGYQVIVVKVKGSNVITAEPFVYGWLQDQKDWGRPVDVLVMPDGALLISDDKANVIYRVSYKK